MTTRPRLATEVNYRNGIGALLLFAVLAWVFAQAPLADPQGFGEGSITRSIGFALFDMPELIPEGHGETESFLVAFVIIAVVLDAALDGAVMLARREDEASILSPVTDGGLPFGTNGGAGSTADGAGSTTDQPGPANAETPSADADSDDTDTNEDPSAGSPTGGGD